MEKTNYNSFAELALWLRAGGADEIKIGETVATEHDEFGRIVWDIIGKDEQAGTVTVFMRNASIWRCFDSPRMEYPLGCNRWAISEIRAWLQSHDVLGGFRPEDAETIKPILKRTYNWQSKRYDETEDKLFLLSASEIGFPLKPGSVVDEGIPYEAFAGTGDEPRRKRDSDGDGCWYWLRSPYSGHAHNVRMSTRRARSTTAMR